MSLFIASSAIMMSCDSAIDSFMVDDTISLMTPGLIKDKVYIGMNDPCEIYVLKSGKGFQEATASIVVDETVLDEYNDGTSTKLAIVPSDCYRFIVSSLDLKTFDYQKPFLIEWNRERLESVLAANPEIGLPLRLSVEGHNININEDRLTTIIQPSLDTPMLSLTSSGLVSGLMPTRRTSLIQDIYMAVAANFIPKEDISYQLIVDPSLVDSYNEEHGTSYKLLPEEAYSLSHDGWQIKKNMKSARYKFTFNREALIPENSSSKFGDYILPVRLESSDAQIDPLKSVMLYSVSVVAANIDKRKWSVYYCNSDVRTVESWEKNEGNFIPEYLIDGSTNTSWRSIWSKPADLPHEICIDFGGEHSLYKITINAPTGSNRRFFNSKSGIVSLAMSPDGPWIKIADWIYPDKVTASHTFEVEPTIGRYMKFSIGESFDGSSKMMIAEISAWGE